MAMKTELKNWIALVVAKEMKSRERADFAMCFADNIRFGFSNMKARDDMPFIMAGNVYGKAGICDGTEIKTSLIKEIKQGDSPRDFIAITSSGSEYHCSFGNIEESLKNAMISEPYYGDSKKYFSSVGSYVEPGTEVLAEFLADIRASQQA